MGDFNGDGVLDLAVANFGSNDVSVLLGNGDGTLRTTLVRTAPLAVADFNGDGWPDVVTANLNSNDVSILLNDGTWTGPGPGEPPAPGGGLGPSAPDLLAGQELARAPALPARQEAAAAAEPRPSVVPYGTLVNAVVSDWPRGDNLMAEFKNIRIAFENMGLPQVAVDHAARLRQTRVLEDGAESFDAGKLRVVLDRSYPLAEAGEAQRALKEGEITGRVVLKID